MTIVTDTPPDQMAGTPAPVATPPAVASPALTAPAQRWTPLTRLAFRFAVIYATLYVLLTQMFYGLFGVILQLLPFTVPPPGSAWSVQTVVSWVAIKVIGFSEPLQVTPTGSGDKPYDWAFAATLLFVSALGTLIWSLAARARLAHPATHRWFRLFLRFAVGATMLSYGMAKFVPLQMPFPSLTRMLTPYGNFSHMGVLWSKIGASPAYEIFTGAVEVACAVLLFIPGLTTVGAFLTFITATQIFSLNMMYDVPVKLFSFHLIVFSTVLLAPDLKRLFRVVVLRLSADAAPEPPLVRRAGLRRGLTVLQIAFGAWLVISQYQGSMQGWTQYGGGAPKPPLYGIWDIDRMEINGVERAPLVTDYDRWRRLVVQNGFAVTFQRMDNTFQGFSAAVDEAAHTITFRQGGSEGEVIGTFTYEQPSANRLIASGTLRGTPMRLETTQVDHTQFLLTKNPFRFIQERPFNR